MKCGNTKEHGPHEHETVAEVRECYGVDSGESQAKSAMYSTMSEKAQKFLSDLLNQFSLELEDGLTPDTISPARGKPILDSLISARRNKAMGKPYKLPDGVLQSANPSRGKSKTRTSTPRIPLPDVPAGYYAVPDWTGKEELKFFRVKRPVEGDWAGRTFVDSIVGGHPNSSCHGAFLRKALEAILEFGPEDAGILYGIKIKQCYSCNRHLTKKASRALSLGRHCAYKRGHGEEWDTLNAAFGDEDAEDNDE